MDGSNAERPLIGCAFTVDCRSDDIAAKAHGAQDQRSGGSPLRVPLASITGPLKTRERRFQKAGKASGRCCWCSVPCQHGCRSQPISADMP
jgi:hypothetical protein